VTKSHKDDLLARASVLCWPLQLIGDRSGAQAGVRSDTRQRRPAVGNLRSGAPTELKVLLRLVPTRVNAAMAATAINAAISAYSMAVTPRLSSNSRGITWHFTPVIDQKMSGQESKDYRHPRGGGGPRGSVARPCDLWIPDSQRTRTPIVLDLWKDIPIPISPTGAWSTVMTWSVFRGKLEFGGTEYHGKAAEFDKIIGLPLRCEVWRVAAPLSPRQSSPRSPVSSPWHWAGCSRHWGTGR
jgi:hypothetical protein